MASHEPSNQGAATAPAALTALGEFRRGGLVLGTSVYGSAVGLAGLSIYCLPFFMHPLEEEFGWSAATVGLAASFLTLGIFLTAPWAGRACDKFGLRKVVPVSVVLYALGLLSLTQIRSPTAFYIGYFALAVLGAGTTYGCYSRAITGLFDKARGMALAIAMSGPAIIAAAAPLILPHIIESYGWRWGWVAMALVALTALPLIFLFLRESAPTAESVARRASGLSIKEALRTRTFWLMWIGMFCVSSAVGGTHIQMLPMLVSMGVERSDAQSTVALYGMSILSGRFLAGIFLDRVHGRYVASTFFILSAVGITAVAVGGPQYAVILAVLLGLTAGCEGDVMAYLTSRYFGMKSYTEIFGWMFGALALGLASGPILTRLLLDLGGYNLLLFLAASLTFVGAVCYYSLGKYPTHAGEQPGH